jgi:hypothetical protein
VFESRIAQAVHDALSGSVDIGAGPVPVKEYVSQPGDAADPGPFPYIVLGDTTMTPWDTDTETGAEATVSIHVWSRYAGNKELTDIHDAIYAALHRVDIDVEDCVTLGCDFEQSDMYQESDGRTRHGVLRYRIVVEPLQATGVT